MFLRRHLSLHNLGTHVRQEGPHATGPSERQLLVTVGLPKQFHFTYSCLPLYGKLIVFVFWQRLCPKQSG